MIILNFTHPLTDSQLARAAECCGEAPDRVLQIPAQLDMSQELQPQVKALADAAELTPTAWQSEQILVVPPALSFSAVLLLAELHGRMGYFPSCLCLRPVAGALPPRFEVAEVMNLQRQRDAARAGR